MLVLYYMFYINDLHIKAEMIYGCHYADNIFKWIFLNKSYCM